MSLAGLAVKLDHDDEIAKLLNQDKEMNVLAKLVLTARRRSEMDRLVAAVALCAWLGRKMPIAKR